MLVCLIQLWDDYILGWVKFLIHPLDLKQLLSHLITAHLDITLNHRICFHYRVKKRKENVSISIRTVWCGISVYCFYGLFDLVEL